MASRLRYQVVASIGTAFIVTLVFALLIIEKGNDAARLVANRAPAAPHTDQAGEGTTPAIRTGPIATQSTAGAHDARPHKTSPLDHVEAQGPDYQIVEDDGQLLWASPTTGKAIPLNYVPQGAQFLLSTRPADLLERIEGVRVLEALGPRFQTLRQAWEIDAGVKLQEVDQLTLALLPQNERSPGVVIVARLKEPMDLPASWERVTPAIDGDAELYSTGRWHYYAPEAENRQLFVMGAREDIRLLMATRGQPPLLRLQLARLQQLSDVNRHLTILVTPNFLFADGRKIFSGPVEKLLDPLQWLLGEQVQAAMLSLHLGDIFYGEVRVSAALDQMPAQFAYELDERLEQLPAKIEQYLGRIQLDWWQPLAVKFPGMIRYLREHTRVAVESNQVVMNFTLPARAAHNLALAIELAIASPPRGAIVATATRPPSPQTLDELLEHRMTLSVSQQSLDRALQGLAADIAESFPGLPFTFSIRILGADLQDEGITRNQQINNLQLGERTVAELLTALVMKANPITTVKDPSEADQKLIWVIGPDPDDPARQAVLITTRKAAQQKGYELPKPFR